MSCLWLPFKHSSFSAGTDRDRSQPVPAAIQPPSEEVYPKEFPLWGFFLTHLLPACISVTSAPPCPTPELPAARKRWLSYIRTQTSEGGGAVRLPLSFSFSTQPFASYILHPLFSHGVRFMSSPDCGLWVLFSFPSGSSLSSSLLGAYIFGPFPNLVYGHIPPKEGAKVIDFGNRPGFKS